MGVLGVLVVVGSPVRATGTAWYGFWFGGRPCRTLSNRTCRSPCWEDNPHWAARRCTRLPFLGSAGGTGGGGHTACDLCAPTSVLDHARGLAARLIVSFLGRESRPVAVGSRAGIREGKKDVHLFGSCIFRFSRTGVVFFNVYWCLLVSVPVFMHAGPTMEFPLPSLATDFSPLHPLPVMDMLAQDASAKAAQGQSFSICQAESNSSFLAARSVHDSGNKAETGTGAVAELCWMLLRHGEPVCRAKYTTVQVLWLWAHVYWSSMLFIFWIGDSI